MIVLGAIIIQPGQVLQVDQSLGKILVLKKVFTISFKVKLNSVSVGNIIKLVDNLSNTLLDVSVNGSSIVNSVLNSGIFWIQNLTLNQWFNITVIQYQKEENCFVSVYLDNLTLANESCANPIDYMSVLVSTSNPAAKASIKDLKVFNGNQGANIFCYQ